MQCYGKSGIKTTKKPFPSGNGLSFVMYGGEDGIRTHVELPPNGFQDRPVMTASVPLQVKMIQAYESRARIIIPHIKLINQLISSSQ